MFAPNVIGCDDVKEGILRSIVGGVEKEGKRGRINLMAGDPGIAKSMLGKESTKIKPNSRYVSSQNSSSTKSLTAIVDKIGDGYILRLGGIPLSKNAICCLNEITGISLEDQAKLYDILEEGRFTKDGFTRSYNIDSPTTIIASCNPVQGTSKDSQKILKDEILLTKPLMDRFDQFYSMRQLHFGRY